MAPAANLLLLIFVILTLLGSLGFNAAYSQTGPKVFPPDSKPYGIDYPAWTAIWWKWFLSMPQNQTAADDPTGERCATNQFDPDVWFVTGTFGGTAERTCTVPAGKAIVVNVVANECSTAEYPELETEPELRECADSGNKPDQLGLTFDGVELQNINDFEIQSPLFDVTMVENNVFGATVGPTKAVSDCYCVILEPPSPGRHELHFYQLTLDDPVSGAPGFAYEITYHLIIEETEFSTTSQSITIADESLDLVVNSSSTISDFAFAEESKQVSFTAMESGVQGVAEIPISMILTGPYTVMLDGNPATNFRTGLVNSTGETSIKLVYPQGTHDVSIIGTNVVPEFSVISLIILASSIFIAIGIMSAARYKKSA